MNCIEIFECLGDFLDLMAHVLKITLPHSQLFTAFSYNAFGSATHVETQFGLQNDRRNVFWSRETSGFIDALNCDVLNNDSVKS